MPRQARKRPLISANFAVTWDGRITTRNRTPADFTSPADKRRLLEIRAQADAVLVTVGTAAADHMTMGLPAPDLRAAREARGRRPAPLRVLVTNSGQIDPALPVFQTAGEPIVVFSTERMPRAVRAALSGKAEPHLFAAAQVDLRAMVLTLAQQYRVRRLHCEGGGTLFRELAAQDLIDELYLTLCPRVFGGESAPTLTGVAGDYLPKSTRLRLLKIEPAGDECFLKYVVERK